MQENSSGDEEDGVDEDAEGEIEDHNSGSGVADGEESGQGFKRPDKGANIKQNKSKSKNK